MRSRSVIRLTIAVAAAALAAGCPPRAETRPDSPQVSGPPPSTPAPEARADTRTAPPAADGALPFEARPIHFTLDSSGLSGAARAELQRIGDHLLSHPEVEVTVLGHTCELGTSEYNLALGYQRARAARDYLVRLGVEDWRVKLTSYGEERPAASGPGEAFWSQNRRDEFELRPHARAERP